MKKVLGIYNNPDRRLVGDGFPVQPLFSYDMLGHRISPCAPPDPRVDP